MIAPFEASRLKFERAAKHLHELDGAISEYFAEKPCVIIVEPFPGMVAFETRAWIARIRKPVPLSLSPIIGDVVHNLRSALDLLACDLVRVSGGNPKGVYFPFCADATELRRKIKARNLHRAGADVVRVIESLKPYPPSELRAIHDMDIADKHQALLPMIGAVSVPIADILGAGPDFPMPHLSTIVTKDGQIIVGLPAITATPPLGTELPTRLLLVFGDGPGFGKREIIMFLRRLTEVASGVINTLSALRPGASFPA